MCILMCPFPLCRHVYASMDATGRHSRGVSRTKRPYKISIQKNRCAVNGVAVSKFLRFHSNVTVQPLGSLRKFEAAPHSSTPWNHWLFIHFGPTPAHEEPSNFWPASVFHKFASSHLYAIRLFHIFLSWRVCDIKSSLSRPVLSEWNLDFWRKTALFWSSNFISGPAFLLQTPLWSCLGATHLMSQLPIFLRLWNNLMSQLHEIYDL